MSSKIMKIILCLVVSFWIIFSESHAYVYLDNGRIGIRLSDYGSIRLYAPSTDDDAQLTRINIIAALSENAVCDYQEDHGEVIPAFQLTSPTLSDIEAEVVYDNNYSNLPPDLTFRLHIYAWNNEPYLIAQYTVMNDSSEEVELYLGLVTLPEIAGIFGGETNTYNATHRVAYCFREGETPRAGFRLLSSEPYSYHALDWSVYSPSDPYADEATDITRYHMTADPGFDAPMTAGYDGSVYSLNAGAYTIPAGDSVILAYAIVYADLESELFAVADSAQKKFKNVSVVSIRDDIQFEFFTRATQAVKEFKVYNSALQPITINECVLDNPVFSLDAALPFILPPRTITALTATISPDSSRLYQSHCHLSYQYEGESSTSSGKIAVGLFLDDNSELAHTAHRVMDLYHSCKEKDPYSIATQNNSGLLYRLLGEPVEAEENLKVALSTALNSLYGYAGIKMNLGVVKSDQDSVTAANTFYDAAFIDVSSTESQSVLTPQIYYNKAWEAYVESNLAEAATQVDKTIAHTRVNDFLKAKAHVLRGAIEYAQGNTSGADSDFRQAMTLDPNGPIGRMAQENLQAITIGVDDQLALTPHEFTLLPNYPNPFNPTTMILFGLPKACEVELGIYNVLGQKVKTLLNAYYQAGWHQIEWEGVNELNQPLGSGIYLISMKASDFKSTLKMTLLR